MYVFHGYFTGVELTKTRTVFSTVFSICLKGVVAAMESFARTAITRKDQLPHSSLHGNTPNRNPVPPIPDARQFRERASAEGWKSACVLFRTAEFYFGLKSVQDLRYFHSADLGFHFLQLAFVLFRKVCCLSTHMMKQTGGHSHQRTCRFDQMGGYPA